MEVRNCTDINGVELNEVQFNLDGTVVGIIEVNNVNEISNLSCACCEANGWVFDPTNTKCYWSSTCITNDKYKILLNPVSTTGAIFQIDENEVGLCHLELEFDWLIKFDCDKINKPLIEILQELKLTVQIEKIIFDESLPIPDNLETVVSQEMFNEPNIANYFNGNNNTGIILSSSNRRCDEIRESLINDLGDNSGVINELSLNSDWVKFKLIIDDESILENIYNERLKISIEGNKPSNFSILIDDIKLNKICDVPTLPDFLDEECPKFELKRVIDNKKSWVENSEFELREFDLARRLTKYTINNEKLSINTKEIDLGINPSQAIETNTFNTIVNNPCLLSPSTGCTSGTTIYDHECIDLTPLVTIQLTEIIDNNELLNMLIDAKSRKTISAYPTIELLYYRYRNAFQHCGLDLNNITQESVNDFIDLIGTYWTDLLEQIVPATTIWGTSLTNSSVNSISGGRVNKYKYKKYTTLPCYNLNYSVPSPISNSSVNVEVLTEDITDDKNIISQLCNTIFIRQINDGSEFIGTVTIIGEGEGPTSGSTISITESIIDECGLYESCEVGSVILPEFDFNQNDFSSIDFN